MTRRNPVAKAVRRLRPTAIRSKKRDLPRKTKHKAADRRPCDSWGRPSQMAPRAPTSGGGVAPTFGGGVAPGAPRREAFSRPPWRSISAS